MGSMMRRFPPAGFGRYVFFGVPYTAFGSNAFSASRNSSVSEAVRRLAERNATIEAGAPPGVARAGAALLDLHPHGILIAVDAHLDDALRVAGGLALAPERAARAAVVPGLAALDGARERLGVHVRDHQHVAGRGIGRDRGHEPVGVEFRRKRAPFLDVLRGAAFGKRIGGSPLARVEAARRSQKGRLPIYRNRCARQNRA